MADPYGFGAEFGAAEIGDAEFGRLSAAAATTSITPDAGSVALQGQSAHTQPFAVPSGNLALTGQQPTIANTITPNTGTLTLTGQAAGNAALSTIVSAEYTGDGTSSRTFESSGTVPLIVFVFGKDGSGNLVGAIKTADMPSGKSQPMEIAQGSSASTRSNRILDLTVNGFTVGSDLNVSGRNYAYIIFPAGRSSTVTTRTFVGPGGKPVVNSTLSASGTSLSGTSIFTSTGDEASGWARPMGSTVYTTGVSLITAGRRLVRNSDGAIIAEVTGAIDADNANGITYISGSFAGGTWHWEEYYVDLLGQVCDMILLMADDTGGATPSVPLTVIKPTQMAAANADWAGNGFGELDVFLASDTDTALHVSPRSSGGAPTLTKGTTYHVVTFHDDEANTGLKLHTFTWTGTGPLGTPPTLSGMDFKPDWAFVYSSGNSFTWSKNTTTILGSNLRDRGWIDGGGDSAQAALASWDSGGVTLTANGDWNGNGTKYLGIFFIADAVVAAITPSAGAANIAGESSTLVLGIPPDAGSLTLTGYQPDVSAGAGTTITPDTGSLSVTGNSLALELGLPQGSGSIDASGGSTTLNFLDTPDTGTLTLTGQQATVAEARDIIPDSGSITVDGQGITEELGVFQDSGALDLTGESPTLLVNFFITPDTGAVTVTGNQPTPFTGTSASPGAGSLTVTGNGITQELDFFQNSGSADLTGFAPGVVVAILITPDTGSLTLSGGDATLSAGIEPGTAGALTLSGTQPTLDFGIITDGGSLTVDGQPASTSGAGSVAAGTGSVVLSGNEPILDFGIIPDSGSLTLVGYTPLFAPAIEITPGAGQVVVIGQPVTVREIFTGSLLVIWNDRSKMTAILPLQWMIVSEAVSATLPCTWDVIEQLNTLGLTWRVIPNLRPAFDETIQQPVATAVETP